MEIINISYPNDGLGDKLRDSMIKVNDNFNELLGLINSLDLSISGITGLDDALNTISASITGLQSQINTLDSNHTTDISTINSNVITINSSIATINDSIADILSQLEPLLDNFEVPNLREVLASGYTASSTSNESMVSLNYEDGDYTINAVRDNEITQIRSTSTDVSLSGSFTGHNYSNIGIFNSRILLSQKNLVTGKITNIEFAEPISSSKLKFPSPVTNGTYTLATTDNLSLNETFYDSYIGTRLTPKNTNVNGFGISKSVNGQVGLSVRNIDGSGNGAISSVSVGGTGSYYENGLSLNYHGGGYYIPSLRKTGSLFSTQDFNFLNVNNSKIDFRTGNTISDATSKFSISSNGAISIGATPSTDNSVTKGLARKSNGDLVEFTIPTVGTTAPISATASGVAGEIRVTSTYIYTCIASNTWVRTAVATW